MAWTDHPLYRLSRFETAPNQMVQLVLDVKGYTANDFALMVAIAAKFLPGKSGYITVKCWEKWTTVGSPIEQEVIRALPMIALIDTLSGHTCFDYFDIRFRPRMGTRIHKVMDKAHSESFRHPHPNMQTVLIYQLLFDDERPALTGSQHFPR
jgi:hypothetical protein